MFKVVIYFFILDRQPQWKYDFNQRAAHKGHDDIYRGES